MTKSPLGSRRMIG